VLKRRTEAEGRTRDFLSIFTKSLGSIWGPSLGRINIIHFLLAKPSLVGREGGDV
jgi:hypothetical protein